MRELDPRRGAHGDQHDVRGQLLAAHEPHATNAVGPAGEFRELLAEPPMHALLGVQVAEDPADGLAEHPAERGGDLVDHRDLGVVCARGRGGFRADPPGADDHDPLGALERRP